MDHVPAVVIGAGVVGLACARELARRGVETLILEQEGAIGTGISARNSEVIHAGLYYPTSSLKAELCVRGNPLLYRYCESHGVDFRRCGKLVVATSAADEPRLEDLLRQGEANGVPGLRVLSREDARELEPELECTAALWSPTTGIIDGHALMLALLGDAQRDGAALALRSPFVRGRITSGGFQLEVGGAESTTITTDILVNAGGLSAQRIGAALEGFPSASIPSCHYAKGNYYSLAGRVPFSRLIYPLPVSGGLGVHLTLDLAGQARFGPDVEWVADLDYHVDPARSAAFYAEVRRYWPSLENGSLQPAYAGIRPKIVGPGEAGADFLIQGAAIHGMPGLVNLFGIESPGLTSCLAIAESVCDMIADRVS